ncbi:MAG: serine--tRNA ligase [bacterium]|nr:serine--tRNA ligase [bacterium]
MIDLKWLAEHQREAEEGFTAKGCDVPIAAMLTLDAERKRILQKVEAVAAEKHAASKELGKLSPKVREEKLAVLRALDASNDADAKRLKDVEQELHELVWNVPNLPLSDVPVGKDGTENVVERTVGERPSFDFTPRPYWELGATLGVFDTERGAKVSGSRFGYLTGPGALLEFAMLNHAMRVLTAEGFTPVIPPALINANAMEAMGYTIHGQRTETYYFEQDDQYLIGTSEQSIGPMHMDEILDETDLPKRYVAFSPCFRREAGSYGKDTKGIFRVHQYDKVEMFSFTTPEQSLAEHEYLLGLEERLLQDVGLPYQVLKMCTGDLGIQAARKFDLEAWFPAEGAYRELTSTSTCTDWQARRLNIRYRPKDGGAPRFVHTLNGTAWSMNRPICAILENFQQADGTVMVPEVLRPWLGMDRITAA